MKKTLLFLVTVLLVVPQIALASWWNPFSWFRNNEAKIVPQKQAVLLTTSTETVALPQSMPSPSKKKEAKTAKVSQPHAKEVGDPSATQAPNLVIPNIPIIPVITAPINPAAQCLPTKSSWNNFANALKELPIMAILNSYSDLAFGTKNAPTSASALFAYNYSRLSSGKNKFYSQTSDVRVLVNSLPQPPYGNTNDLLKIKKGYLDSLAHLENSYDLALQAFKIFGDHPDGYVSQNELYTSKSLFKDSNDEYYQALSSLQAARDVISMLQNNMQNGGVSNCAFTFYDDRTIKTTIDDELLFTQYVPESWINKSYTEVSISLPTALPVEISQDGMTKTVMKLSCDRYGATEYFPVERILGTGSYVNLKQVRTVLGKISGNRKCRFIYTGNGDTLYSGMTEFNL